MDSKRVSFDFSKNYHTNDFTFITLYRKGDSVVMKGHTGPVNSVKFSQDSKLLITSSDDKLIKIWSLPSRKFLSSHKGHSNWVRAANFSPDSKLVVSGGEDKLVKLWDTETTANLYTFHDHNDHVNKVSFNVDGNSIASASDDKSIKVWDLRSHQLIQHYTAHSQAVTDLSIHPSGNYMLSSSKDSSIRVWDIREGRLLYTLQGHTGGVNGVSFSPCGNFFSSGGVDQLVMVWKANSLGIIPDAWDKDKAPRSPSRPVSGVTRVKPPRGSSVTVPPSPPPAALQEHAKKSVPSKTKAAPKELSLAGMNADRDRFINVPGSPELVARDALPPALTNTLDHIVGQLSLISRTMAILEQRITLNENRISSVSASSRGLNPVFPEQIQATRASDDEA